MNKLSVAAVVLLLSIPATAQESYVESIEVRVVNVDVVVTDRAGVPISDLEREDFELRVGGRRVEIAYFSRIAEGRIVEDPLPDEPAAFDAPAPAPRIPVTWAVFVDQTSMPPTRRNEALGQLRTFLGRSMQPGDQGIVAINDGSFFRIRRGATTDRGLVLESLASLEKERFNPGPAVSEKVMLRVEIQYADEWTRDAVKKSVQTLVDAEAARTRNAIAALGTFVDAIAGVEGRLALVYLGAGFTTLPGMEIVEILRQKFPFWETGFDVPRPEDYQAVLGAEVSKLFERISATRATLYTIHASQPSGPTADDPGDIEMTRGMQADREKLTEAGIAREMAERTGGLYFKSGQWLDGQMESVRADLSRYYSLGFVPDGKVRGSEKIRVVVNRDGARVRHREAVRERTQREEAEDAVVAALFDSGLANPLDVTVEVGASRRAGSGRGRTVPVKVIVPVSSLSFIQTGETHYGGLTFHFAIAGEDGTIWRLESREQTLEFTRDEFPTALRQTVAYSVDVPMQAARLTLAISVQDRTALVRSALSVPLGTGGRGRGSDTR